MPVTRASDPVIGVDSSISSPLPAGGPSRISVSTTSASSISTMRCAVVDPTNPPPTTVTFFRISLISYSAKIVFNCKIICTENFVCIAKLVCIPNPYVSLSTYLLQSPPVLQSSIFCYAFPSRQEQTNISVRQKRMNISQSRQGRNNVAHRGSGGNHDQPSPSPVGAAHSRINSSQTLTSPQLPPAY